MLVDKYGRRIDYLRISVTDRCNLRCIYCMPEWGIVNKPHEELLTFEEIVEIVKSAVKLGIDKLRLTGGEPLIRKNLVNLISSLSQIEGIKDLALTTNGILLKEFALALKKAGLKRVNISLDSLSQDRYNELTRQGRLGQVLEGIQEAFRVGLSPIKINVLLLEGIKKEEMVDFLRLTKENPIHIRFLEFMPINSFYKVEKPLSCAEIINIAQGSADIEKAEIIGN